MTNIARMIRAGLGGALLIFAVQPATAELPEPVREMVEAAIANGKKETVAAVIAIARQTNPDDADELDAIQEAFDKRQQELAAKEAEARQTEILSAGLFERWSGKGQIGAFQSSGNSSNVGVSLALALTREGIDWSHRIKASSDYQRSNGVTSREQYMLSYEPRFQINPQLFAYGLAQYESDRFQGFSSRYSASGGLGYRVIDKSDLQLSVKAGPAWRQTDFVDGRIESKLAALIGMDFDWAITDRISLTQDTNMVADAGGSATAIIDSANTTLNLVTGMEAKISDALTTRLSYTLEYDSNPPAGSVSTDTLTRFTLVYGF